MKRFYLIITLALLASGTIQTRAQSLKDLLNKESIEDIVNTITDQMDIIPENIEGEWEYNSIDVKFTGDNALMNAASEVAVSKIEDKLTEYMQIIGLKEGTFGYRFNPDGSFTTSFLKLELPGKYTFSSEEDSIELAYGSTGKLKGVKMKATAKVNATNLELLFNADKLMEFLGKISSSSDNQKLAALNQLISQYDGLKIGFELKRKAK
ncbi:MAG: DUF4923 family protein [Bacteroidetes bacterium]|uniref:DUF4923 family protein n=1 Tax=Candidatus Merdivivens pullistercoris TaxID=2840873 RepID=A0A9D9I4Y1_9BACT|nr:DUF4923 family protein [Candidatus Merdivivens pullistercoris]